MFCEIKKQAKETLKIKNNMYKVTILYLISIIFFRFIIVLLFQKKLLFLFGIYNDSIMMLVMDLIILPLNISYIYNGLQDNFEVKNLLYFLKRNRFFKIFIIDIIIVLIGNFPLIINKFNNSIMIFSRLEFLLKLISVLISFCSFMFFFVFEYLFVKEEGEKTIFIIYKTFKLIKSNIKKILLFQFSFAIWYLAEFIIFAYLSFAGFDKNSFSIFSYPIMFGIGVYFQPYYLLSKISFLNSLEK